MKKLIFKKFFQDVFLYFLLILLTLSVIVWIIQSVNFLDLVTKDGHSLKIYAYYSMLNFPKIISRIMLFVIFLSVFMVILNYESRNETLIFWINGVTKLEFANKLVKFSLLFMLIQLFFGTFLVPFTQDKAKSFIRGSNIGYLQNIIKEKTFFDGVKNLTIFVNKKEDNIIYDVFINDNKPLQPELDNPSKSFQTIYAEKGQIEQINGNTVLILFKGKFIQNNDGHINSFSFDKTQFSLSNYESKTVVYRKIQETNSLQLLYCFKEKLSFISSILENYKSNTLRCEKNTREDILIELFKRSYLPLYIPILSLVCGFLFFISKDQLRYNSKKILIFVYGFLLISLSEISIRYSAKYVIPFLLIPITIFLFNYIYFYYKLEKKK